MRELPGLRLGMRLPRKEPNFGGVQLKEAVLEAVEPEIPKPESPVTPQSAIASAAKTYKSAAVELKDLMVHMTFITTAS